MITGCKALESNFKARLGYRFRIQVPNWQRLDDRIGTNWRAKYILGVAINKAREVNKFLFSLDRHVEATGYQLRIAGRFQFPSPGDHALAR
jgi:hypothetical protein